MTLGLNINGNDTLVENSQSINHQHEGSVNPHLKECLTKSMLEGLERGRQAVKESLDAGDDLNYLRELKSTLQQHYNKDTKVLKLTPQLIEQFDAIRQDPANASKASILNVIGITAEKVSYTKEEIDAIRENINQDIEATSKRLDHAHHRGTEIYNMNMQIIQMLKSIVKGADNALSAANRRIHK